MSFRFCRRYFSVDMLRACKLEKERTISDGKTNRYVARLCRQAGKQMSRYSLCICGRAEHCFLLCRGMSAYVFRCVLSATYFSMAFQELMQAMFIFAVPIFFMVSGMNLLDYRKKYSTKVFFKKRFVRVGRALILGSIACYLLFGLLPGLFYGAQSIADGFGPVDFCKRFLTNSIIDIYWFLYSIIYLYLLTPLLSKIVHDRRLLEYAIALTLFCSILIPAAKAIGINEKYFSPLLSWPLFASSALLYFLLGYYLENYGLPLHWNAPAWAATFLGSVTLMFLGGLCWNGFFQNSMGVEYQNYLVGISSPLCVISAVSLFMLCKALEPSLQRGSDRMKSIIRKVSSVSLGVYMFHLLLVNLTLGGPFERILTFGQYHPFIKAIAVYLLTGIAVYAGKWCISKVKRALLSK
jgi:surface polysaccharide O-acyltransferase-like enzyme